MYVPDAALMMTNIPIVKGVDIKPLLKEIMADPNFSMSFNTAKVEAPESGEFGYTRGTYTLTMTDPKSKKVLRESGKYLTVYAKQADGSWWMTSTIAMLPPLLWTRRSESQQLARDTAAVLGAP